LYQKIKKLKENSSFLQIFDIFLCFLILNFRLKIIQHLDFFIQH
jgi:hypothetical protein